MSFINNIFRKKNHVELKEAINLGILHTDIHSHLIPGIDDGSKTMDESIVLIKEMHALGYKKLITTPHIMNDYYKNTPKIINDGLEKLRIAIKKENIDIEIEAAAEYMLDDGFEEKLKSGKLLTFGDNYVLVEMSYMTEYPDLSSIFFQLQTEGYKVVLAHPERYTYWHQTFYKYQELRDRNIFLQMNINSLTGWYSPESRKIARKLLENDLIQFLGSDLHNEQYLSELKRSRHSHTLSKHIEGSNILNNTL